MKQGLTRRSLLLVSMHSLRQVARKSTWSCISSSTVRLGAPGVGSSSGLPSGLSSEACKRLMNPRQFGSMTSDVQKYSSCWTKMSMRELENVSTAQAYDSQGDTTHRKHQARFFHSSIFGLPVLRRQTPTSRTGLLLLLPLMSRFPVPMPPASHHEFTS